MAPEAAPPADTAKPIPVAEADDDVPVGPDKYGNFSDPGSFNVGVPYTGKDPLAQGNTRLRGVNMKAPSARSGKGNDAAFDRLKPLYQKEPFQVSAKEKREARAKAESEARVKAANEARLKAEADAAEAAETGLSEDAAGNGAPDTAYAMQGPDTQNIIQPLDFRLCPLEQIDKDGTGHAPGNQGADGVHKV